MEMSVKIAWALLALLHVMPALSALIPGLIYKLYRVPSDGVVGTLLIHRGVLFIAVCITALYAMFDPDSRKLASIIVFISMVGFLLVYLRAGMVPGELRKIAFMDLIGLAPLFWVSLQAWQ